MVLDFFDHLKSINDDTVKIKMISTILHFLGPKLVDFGSLKLLSSVLFLPS